MERIYFHEDIYCQVEFVPRENWKCLESENRKIDVFSAEHFEGAGFTDIYERDEYDIKTIQRQIEIWKFEELLTDIGFTKVSNVHSGYGNFEEKCSDTFAFTIDNATIFYDTQESLIENIWIDGFRFSGESNYVEHMIQGLSQIGKRWNLVLNDWDLCETVDLEREDAVKAYIRDK